LVSSAVLFGLVAVMSDDHNLILLTMIFAGATVLLYVVKEFVSPFIRRRRLMSRPFDLFFNVTSADRTTLGYVHQDAEQHKTVDLTVPSHTDDLYIQLLMQTKLAFQQSELVFGFDGDNGRYPLIKYWTIGFIKVGIKEKHPGISSDHYIDHHDRYHVVETKYRPKGNWITCGFKIQTRDPGIYRGRLEMLIEDVEFTSSLTLNVEDSPKTVVRCVDHPDCFIRPVVP
jgi:hypothetical protein